MLFLYQQLATPLPPAPAPAAAIVERRTTPRPRASGMTNVDPLTLLSSVASWQGVSEGPTRSRRPRPESQFAFVPTPAPSIVLTRYYFDLLMGGA